MDRLRSRTKAESDSSKAQSDSSKNMANSVGTSPNLSPATISTVTAIVSDLKKIENFNNLGGLAQILANQANAIKNALAQAQAQAQAKAQAQASKPNIVAQQLAEQVKAMQNALTQTAARIAQTTANKSKIEYFELKSVNNDDVKILKKIIQNQLSNNFIYEEMFEFLRSLTKTIDSTYLSKKEKSDLLDLLNNRIKTIAIIKKLNNDTYYSTFRLYRILIKPNDDLHRYDIMDIKNVREELKNNKFNNKSKVSNTDLSNIVEDKYNTMKK